MVESPILDSNLNQQQQGNQNMTLPNDSEIEKVLSGESSVLFVRGDDPRNQPVCVISGAFNPLHRGHRQMAAVGATRLERPVIYELCVANADKMPLSLEETRNRIQQEFDGHPVALTRAPTFLEKAAIFPGATFLVGVDTVYRVALPRFYDDEVSVRDMAINELQQYGCRFLVFGREIAGRFISLSDVSLPNELLAICDELTEDEFRSEESSSKLRDEDA